MNMTKDEEKIVHTKTLQEPRLHKKRWFILFLYVVASPCGSIQWSQYVIIADVVVDHFQVSYNAVNWTFSAILLNFIIFSYPSCYIIDKYGVRVATLIGAGGICVASWIKILSVSPNNFWLIVIAQFILSVTQTCLLNIPPKLAATWFGPDEVARACSIAVVGLQIGQALGVILPPLLIKKETVKNDFFTFSIGLAIICTVIFFVCLICFTDKPRTPPSYAVMNQEEKNEHLRSTKNLLQNLPFVMILISVGLNSAIITTIETFSNEIILKFHPANASNIGWISFCMIISGIVGCVLGGVILDKFKIYRSSLLALSISVPLIVVVFTYTLRLNIIFSYILCILLCFIGQAYWTVALQVAIETSYPEPEALVYGFTNILGHALGIGYTYLYTYFFYNVNDVWANTFLSSTCFISFVIMVFTKFQLKRQAANLKTR